MHSAKRAWIYQGLALADGVGLVAQRGAAAPSPVLEPGWGLTLFGDAIAEGLLQPLMQLASPAVRFTSYCVERARPEDWLLRRWVDDLVRNAPPRTLFAGAFEWVNPLPVEALLAIERRVEGAGGIVAWLAPPQAADDAVYAIEYAKLFRPHHVFRSDGLEIQLGADGVPTAVGYAGWAGSFWAWLT